MRDTTRDPASGAMPIGDDEAAALLRPLESFSAVLLAISGGADSMALLNLAARWRDRLGPRAPRLAAATVDHRLRPEAVAEVQLVAAAAARLGVPHRVAVWTDGAAAGARGGLQAAARTARYRLLAEAAERLGAPSVAIVTAHTEDDQAETVAMRLARGSGLDGLAGIPSLRRLEAASEVMLARPLLGVPRRRLVATLAAAGLAWAEDASNDDDGFERVAVRRALDGLAAAGVPRRALARSAARLQRARSALAAATAELLSGAVEIRCGAAAFVDRERFDAAPEEIRIRALGALVSTFGGSGGPARLDQVEALAARIAAAGFRGETVGGAVVRPRDGAADVLVVHRETGRGLGAAVELAPGGAAFWDARFRVALAPGAPAALAVSALGAGDARMLHDQTGLARGVPVAALSALPAFRDRDGRLVAVPSLRHGQGCGEARGDEAGTAADLVLPWRWPRGADG